MYKVQRVNQEIECEVCGTRFKQTRWWQVFCSKKCKNEVESEARKKLRDALQTIKELEEKVLILEQNARRHLDGPGPFKYDDENQEYNYGSRR